MQLDDTQIHGRLAIRVAESGAVEDYVTGSSEALWRRPRRQCLQAKLLYEYGFG